MGSFAKHPVMLGNIDGKKREGIIVESFGFAVAFWAVFSMDPGGGGRQFL